MDKLVISKKKKNNNKKKTVGVGNRFCGCIWKPSTQTVTNNALIRCCQTSQLLCKDVPHGLQHGDQKNHTYCGFNLSVCVCICVLGKTSHK